MPNSPLNKKKNLQLPFRIHLRYGIHTLLISLTLMGCTATNTPTQPTEPGSYQWGEQALSAQLAKTTNTQRAEGIILFVGDGMSLATVTAGRIYAGQQLGKLSEEHELFFESFPHVALAKTYNTNQQTPDSAGTMTAMITGSKTRAGVISIAPVFKRGSSEHCNQGHLKTLLEIAEDAGWSTGIVTTTAITHATPAAAYAHSADRNWESDSNIPSSALTNGCKDIASQLVDFNHGDGVDVILGGGAQYFTGKPSGVRSDGRELIEEWKQRFPLGGVVNTQQALAHVNPNSTKKLLGLFADKHMAFEFDRPLTKQPSLSQMVDTALQILTQDKRFLLIVESGRIDHAHHYGNAFRALHELQEFDKATSLAAKQVDLGRTLMVVTADHSHTLTLSGYPTRGNPILEFVTANNRQGEADNHYLLAADGQPFTTLSYANGLGHCNHYDDQPTANYKPCTDGLQQEQIVNTNDSPAMANYQQQASVPLISETHGADDVPVYAQGPWSHLLNGVIEQNVIFHIMKHAGGL